jgi:uncharacterized protein YigE (DUF2233 family)
LLLVQPGRGRRRVLAWLAWLCAALAAPACGAEAWRELAPGLHYRAIDVPVAGGGRVPGHAFRADPRRVRVAVLDARAGGRARASVKDLRGESGAWVVLNGGFFDEKGAPLGLVVSRGALRNPLRRVDWGVFALRGDAPSIVHTKEYVASGDVSEALQVGPRLVVAGRPTQLKPQSSRRSALCVHADGRVSLVATESVDARDLARLLAAPEAEGGLACSDALNLDGGPSTQLSARAGDFALEVTGGWPVPNAVAFAPR